MSNLPFGACTCERFFSNLRRLNTWYGATMTKDRLCGLAMPHVHCNVTVGQISSRAIIKKWNSSGNRRFDGAVAIDDSNWYIKHLNNIEIEK